eukprot:1385280-Amorphochlora_amoeboformis.AAC.1
MSLSADRLTPPHLGLGLAYNLDNAESRTFFGWLELGVTPLCDGKLHLCRLRLGLGLRLGLRLGLG